MTYILTPALPPTPTPSDYHRVHFDPAKLPARRIVGLLACQRDPLLRKLRTRVINTRPASVAAPPTPKGKANKKKPPQSATPTSTPNGSSSPNGDATPSEPKGKLWEVELEDTVIFPEGGGQPFDTGTIVIERATAGESSKPLHLKVEGCLRRKLESVHLVRVPGESSTALEDLAGQEVDVEVDWARRMDHMSLHTAQHLLSAVLDTYAEGLPTLSWCLAPYPSLEAPYIELPRGLTWAEAEEVERKCNGLIGENRKVWVDVDTQEEGYVKMTAAGVRENRGIPEDYTNGVIRHINIDGIDRNACCGTQTPSLSHLSFIHIIPPSTPSTSTKPSSAPTKLSFVSGPRGISFLQQSSRTLSLASQALGVSRPELPDRVAKLDETRRETASREKDVRAELARLLGEGVARNATDSQGVYWLHRTDKSTHDFEFMGQIVASLLSSQPSAGALEAPVVIVTSALPGSTQSLMMVNSPSADLAKIANEKLKAALEEGEGKGRVKGGGAKGRFMCKVEGKWGKGELEKVQTFVHSLRQTKEEA